MNPFNELWFTLLSVLLTTLVWLALGGDPEAIADLIGGAASSTSSGLPF